MGPLWPVRIHKLFFKMCTWVCLVLFCCSYIISSLWTYRVLCIGSSGELFMCSRGDYAGVYFPRCEATREINTNITIEWAHNSSPRQCMHYFISCTTWWANKWWSEKSIPYIDTSPYLVCLYSGDDVIVDYMTLVMTSQLIVQHLTWLDSCDARKSNSLDTDFIHGLLCEKSNLFPNIPQGYFTNTGKIF